MGLKQMKVGYTRVPTMPVASMRPQRGLKVMNYATTNKKRVLSDGDIARRIREFPGEDAPGTGHRHFPSVFEQEARLPVQKHEMKSTEECYRDFPTYARASCPLSIQNKVPSGQDVMENPDSGPATGNRRMPKPVDNNSMHQIDPVDPLTTEARLRELEIRRSC